MLTLGRILFAILFIFSGATKLLNIPATAADFQSKVKIPAFLNDYTTQLATAADLPINQIFAISAGALEVVCGLLIALNFGARFFAIVLAIFVVAATFYGHNFWDMPDGVERTNNMIHALKNLSLIGGLLIIAGLPRPQRQAESAYPDV